MKILLITPFMPYPLSSGGAQAQFHLINSLRDDFEFTICFPLCNDNLDNYNKLRELWTNVDFRPYQVNDGKIKRVLASILWQIAYKIFRFKQFILGKIFCSQDIYSDAVRNSSVLFMHTLSFGPFFEKHLRNIIASNKFDLVQIEFFEFLPLVRNIPSDITTVFIHHEIRFVRAMREMVLFLVTTQSDRGRLIDLRTREIALLRKYDYIVTLTAVDKIKLEEYIPEIPIIVSPPLLECSTTKRVESKDFIFANKLIFIGGSAHFPNIDGVRWFIDDILPLIWKENKDIKLYIIGEWEYQYIAKWSSPQIVFTGYIDDISDIANGAIAVIPIRIGSGLRIKIIDAANHRIPFVTTSVGVEGLDFLDNIDCGIADSAIDFSHKVILLFKDKNMVVQMTENAALKINQICSGTYAIDTRKNFYNQVKASI